MVISENFMVSKFLRYMKKYILYKIRHDTFNKVCRQEKGGVY